MMIMNWNDSHGRLKGRQKVRQADRRDWLLKLDGLLGLPSDRDDVTAEGRVRLDQVLANMRQAGLYHATSDDAGCRDSIRKLVGEIRRKGLR